MRLKVTIVLMVLSFCFRITKAQKRLNSSAIIITVKCESNEKCDKIELSKYSVQNNLIADGSKIVKEKLSNGLLKWVVYTNNPLYFNINSSIEDKKIGFISEPGDNISINFNDSFTYSGKGSEKIKLRYEIEALKSKVKKPSNTIKYKTNSVADYLEWNSYLNEQLVTTLSLIESYKNRLSQFAYRFIKFNVIGRIEEDRKDKFTSLKSEASKLGLTPQNLCDIFDSTLYGNAAKWMMSQPIYHSSYYSFVRHEVYRKYGYNNEFDSLKSQTKRKFLYYDHGKNKFKGIVREKFLVELITDQTIGEIGFVPEAELLLSKYYSEPGFPEYKKYVREYVEKARVLKPGKPVPDYQLVDISGDSIFKNDFKGKIVLMDFWFTGCIGCAQITPAMRRVKEVFKNDSNVVFANVSIDKEKSVWLRSIEQRKFTTGDGLNLYTGGLGRDHEMIKTFDVTSYPKLFLLDPYGKIVVNPVPDPRHNNGNDLIALIKQQLVLLKDGPFVMYKKNSINSYLINGSQIHTKELRKNNENRVSVQTDEYNNYFIVNLKQSHSAEPSVYPQPEKLFCVSDIEGNFDVFRRLLQANKIIDQDFNWLFDKGHLIVNGDVFDRGQQVTECLWLIYSLEEKAKAAGGYVHFILGNHEVMNLSGNTRYVRQKYIENVNKIDCSYKDLYNNDSELGKWLRTKNIIEKIGDLLFTHGGISENIIKLPLSIEEINNLARPFYDKESLARESTNDALKILYHSKLSPFWYRLYYQDKEMKTYTNGDTLFKTSMKIVEDALNRFDVKKIITGHTIISDTVSVHYEGKVINIDTKHSEGKSEALFVEGNRYYRVNDRAEKVMLDLHEHSIFTRVSGELKKYSE